MERGSVKWGRETKFPKGEGVKTGEKPRFFEEIEGGNLPRRALCLCEVDDKSQCFKGGSYTIFTNANQRTKKSFCKEVGRFRKSPQLFCKFLYLKSKSTCPEIEIVVVHWTSVI